MSNVRRHSNAPSSTAIMAPPCAVLSRSARAVRPLAAGARLRSITRFISIVGVGCLSCGSQRAVVAQSPVSRNARGNQSPSAARLRFNRPRLHSGAIQNASLAKPRSRSTSLPAMRRAAPRCVGSYCTAYCGSRTLAAMHMKALHFSFGELGSIIHGSCRLHCQAAPNPSVERTFNSWLRHLLNAAHLKR